MKINNSSHQLPVFSVMGKLPATSYVRMVDIWLIFTQLVPFIEVGSFLNHLKSFISRLSFLLQKNTTEKIKIVRK